MHIANIQVKSVNAIRLAIELEEKVDNVYARIEREGKVNWLGEIGILKEGDNGSRTF